ncbi:cardiolipin synthase [Fredinandcohnia humi]
MSIVFGIVLAILILFLLLRLDYTLGRKSHLKKSQAKVYPLRKSDLTFYNDGQKLFKDFFSEVDKAEDHIHIQFYILKNDEFSNSFVTLLTKKAQQGVEVRLLLDWVGSKSVTKEMENKLKNAGVALAYSNKPTFPYWFYKLNARNHRKVAAIDGNIGFIGGFNIGKEYIGKDEKFGLWRDYHVKIQGEGVADLQTQFIHDWFIATDQVIAGRGTYFPPLPKGKSEMRLVATDGAYLEEHLIKLLKKAKREIMIGSPYFVPGDKLKRELFSAARRGIHLRVLLPKKADHPLVKEASYPFINELASEGIRFFMFTEGFYHAKVIIIDDEICDIGTTNFDKRSLYSNYEINCYIFDSEFVQFVMKEIQKDFEESTELTKNEIEQKMTKNAFKIKIATLLSHFL